ncbi:MAG: carboxymuconolactone decarboxylase family protein [Betaproteobacteria bacterium]|nr:carboxymuconolactone decarboxylase family protein [Betaproteobacteria bacterium]
MACSGETILNRQPNARARAMSIYRKLGWGETQDGKPFDQVDPELWGIITNVMFGHIWSRPGLSLRDREMITLAALITEGTPGMKLHMRNAHKVGVTQREIREIIFQVMYYAGQAKGIFAMRCLQEVMAETPSAVKAKRTANKRRAAPGNASKGRIRSNRKEAR